MTVTPVSELLKITKGTVIPQVRATVKAVAERYPSVGWAEEPMSDGSKRQWSLQTIIVTQDGEDLEVQIANKEPILTSAIGSDICFIAHQKARGGMSGVRIDEDEGRKVLRISASGELVFAQSGSTIGQPSAGSSSEPISKPKTTEPISVTEPATTPLIGAENRAGGGPVPAWQEIAFNVDKFGELYELCQARAQKMNLNDEALVTSAANKLFDAILDWIRGELPGELPSSK